MEEILKYCKEFDAGVIDQWSKRAAFVMPILEALAAARKELAEQAWRPIAEAPTDGTRVLVFDPSWERHGPGVGIRVNRVQQGWPDGKIHWQEYGTFTHFRTLPQSPQNEVV